MKAPKKWKMAIVIWLAIYPLITVVSFLIGPMLSEIELVPVRTLIMTLILVPVMVFFMIPLVQKLLKPWLHK